MGRLEVNIRHGGDGPGGAVIALILFIVLAAAGGAGHKALSSAAHDGLTVIEDVLWVLFWLVAAAAVTGAVVLGWRIRNAVRTRRAAPPAVITIIPEHRDARPLRPDGRPAIGPAGTARTWPLPGSRQEARPRTGRDDHRGGAS